MTTDFPRTAGQSAALLIREQILNGSLAPGTTLNQNDLAQALGMSRIPIRDALRSLAAEGLIEMRAHQSALVSPLSLDDLEELYELRLALEPNLCVRALPYLTSDDLDEMGTILEELRSCEDATEWLQLNTRFHAVLYRRSERPRTIEIIERARQATGRYTRIHRLFDPGGLHTEHEMIYEAARAGQGRRLASLISAHLSDGYETLLHYVAQQEGFPAREEGDGQVPSGAGPSGTGKEGMHR